MADFKYCLS